MLFALISRQVADRGPLLDFDRWAGPLLVRHQPPAAVGETLADLGAPAVALPVLAAAIAYALWRGARIPPLAAAVAMALVPVSVTPLKEAFARPGPRGPLIGHYAGFYPSGHAAVSAMAFGGAAVLLLPYAGSARWRWPIAAGAVLLGAGCGLGLVWRTYHWPLDVLASWCLCGVLLCGLVWVSRRRPGRSGPPPRAWRVRARPGR